MPIGWPFFFNWDANYKPSSDMPKNFYLWERMKKTLRNSESPKQLAAGVAFGVLIGIIPKDSIVPVLLIVALILSPASLWTSLLSGLFCQFAASTLWMKQAAARLGNLFLESSLLEPVWTFFLQIPYAAWFRWDNNTTLGLNLLAIILSVPAYFLAKRFFSKVSWTEIGGGLENFWNHLRRRKTSFQIGGEKP